MSDKTSLHDRLARRILRWAVRYAIKRGDHFATYHERPKRAEHIGTWSEPTAGEPCAIVLQGPLAQKDDFTIETLLLYRRHFPHCPLILSTWQDTEAKQLDAVRALGVDVVLSEKPSIAGICNVNMQLVSAAAGMRAASLKDVQWVMKTRTDQRLYHPDAVAYLVALAKNFPPAAGVCQRHRIIGVGQGSLKFAPYHVTDQTVFGHVEDMLTYWTPSLREEMPQAGGSLSRQETFVGTPIGQQCRHVAAESYITSSFLERIGRTLDWTLADSWAAYRDHFCFADYGTTDFYWVKGQSFSLREFTTVYDYVTNRQEFSFREWLLMQSGALKASDALRFQQVLEDQFNQPVPAPR